MARDGRWRKSHPDNPGWTIVPYQDALKVGWTWRIEDREGRVVSPNPRARLPWNRHNGYSARRSDAIKAAQASSYFECRVEKP